MKKLIGIVLVLMILMTQVCVFANSGSSGGSGSKPLYTVEKAYTNDIADIVFKVSDEYPVNGQEVRVLAEITAKQEIAADAIKFHYGSDFESVSSEITPVGEKISYEKGFIYNKDIISFDIKANGESMILGGFGFRNEIKMQLTNISAIQTAATENLYEFEICAVAENVGSLDVKGYSINAMKGETVLHSYEVERTNAKEKSDELKTKITINKSEFKNNKYSFDFVIEYDRKELDKKSVDAVVTTVLSLENLSAEVIADNGDTGFTVKLTGKVKNSGALDSGEVKINILSGETEIATVSVDKVGGFTDKGFTKELVLPKAAFDAENSAEITVEIDSTEISLPCTVTYSTEVESVLINGKNAVSIAQGKTLNIALSYAPVTAQPGSEPTISIENTEIATVADGVVTAVAEGETNICVQLGDDTFKVPLTVTRALAEGEILDIKVYTKDADGNKTYRNLYNINKNADGFVYSDTAYSVHLNGSEKSAGFEFTLADGQSLYVSQTSLSSGKTSTVDDYTNIGVPTRKNRISVSVNGTSGVIYQIALNKLPELTEDVPETFYAFTKLETNLKLDNFFDDFEDEKKIDKIEVRDSEKNVLGECVYDSEEGWYWRYTTKETAKTMDAVFEVTDKDGGKASKNIKLVCGKDTENPSFGTGSAVSASGATSNSVTVSWSKATDNDMIKEYVVNYSKSSSMSGAKTVTVAAGEGVERKKTISGLNSGTKYYVTVTAYDRSGNSVESDTDYFTTSSGGSSGGGLGGSSGSGGSSGLGNLGGLGGIINPPVSGPVTGQTKKFDDIENYAWAKDAINALASKGIVNGVSETEFAPANNIKRCDLALMIVRAFGFTGANGVGFSDVPTDAYYADAVKTAQALGIINGLGDGKFGPQDFVTRQDMAVMLQRALAKKNIALSGSANVEFADADQIAGYAKYAVETLAKAGVITGDENKNANPVGNATRAELAVMIYRALAAAKLI